MYTATSTWGPFVTSCVRLQVTYSPNIHRQIPSSFQPLPGESLITSAFHELTGSRDVTEYLKRFLEKIDEHYNNLENLRALQIEFPPESPQDDHNAQKDEDAIKKIVRCLPLLRARRNFSLTFTIKGKPVSWEVLEDGVEDESSEEDDGTEEEDGTEEDGAEEEGVI